ncbi:AIPR family protein [Candidatus Mycobacterium wuenschmannii]|uniref:AIPR family protein n=1 Tax=Candidatus Mycobacterium wuenschmannii TaxID=3027808 RepID=A0ABY8VY14_9MYCO|nr:AIPR family protein [Candidatus Mycobacterium wuenschmannii]WIM87895.1 AIPR family protein [Candidatus Mycobacterium wuenschmannii]
MGDLHVAQIKRRLKNTTYTHIDVSDLSAHSAEHVEQAQLTRALAAFVLTKVAGLSDEDAAASVTDGPDDNGIDAIAYVDSESPRLYVVQSKWSNTGTKGASMEDMIKFQKGLADLVSMNWERFNGKVKDRAAELDDILLNTDLRIEVIFASMGTPAVAENVRGHMDDYVATLNVPTEVATFSYANQGFIYKLLVDENQSSQIDLTVELSDWGRMEGPPEAVYGHLSGTEVAGWLRDHGDFLLSRNVRVVLPNSEVNNSVLETVLDSPENFWYFNNGVTALCESIDKAPAGGPERRQGTFGVKGVSVVNGAQTVGTLARALRQGKQAELDKVRVMVRFISLESTAEDFGKRVTRATNTQNVIGGRDFVGLDPEQARLRDDFAVDNLTYAFRSGEARLDSDQGCEFGEAAVALACAQSAALATQAKREVSRLWDDTTKSPYKALFNAETNHLRVWRSVLILRAVDQELDRLRTGLDNRTKGYAVHGNRLIAHLVFARLDLTGIQDHAADWNPTLARATELTATVLNTLKEKGEAEYGGYTASLFKNASKTDRLATLTIDALESARGQ